MSDSTPDSDAVASKFQAAMAKHESGDLQNAERDYKELLETFPDNPKLNYLIGCLYLDWDYLEGSIRHFRHSLSVEKGTPCQMALMTAYFKIRNYTSAASESQHVLESSPADPKVLYILGYSSMESGDYERAEKAYRTLYELHSGDPQSHANLGELFRRQGKLDWAASAFSSALAIEAEHLDSLVGLGRVHINNNQLDNAENVLRKALAKYPDDPRPHLYLGELFVKLENYAWAAGAAKSACEKDPTNVEAMLMRGFSHDKINEPDKAELAYRQAFYRAPDDPKVKFLLARSCLRTRNAHWAVSLLGSLVDGPGVTKETLDLLAFAHLQVGQQYSALSCMRQAILSELK